MHRIAVISPYHTILESHPASRKTTIETGEIMEKRDHKINHRMNETTNSVQFYLRSDISTNLIKSVEDGRNWILEGFNRKASNLER